MKPQSLNRKPQKQVTSYSIVKILAILLIIGLLIWFANMQIHEPYYANYLLNGA